MFSHEHPYLYFVLWIFGMIVVYDRLPAIIEAFAKIFNRK